MSGTAQLGIRTGIVSLGTWQGRRRSVEQGSAPAWGAHLPADRIAARLAAHAMLEKVQSEPDPELLDRWVEEALAAGWAEIHTLLLYSRLLVVVWAGAATEPLRAAADALLTAAVATEDEILVAWALAARAQHLTGRPELAGEDLGGALTRAVAILDDVCEGDAGALGLRAVELPACYVECGNAYCRQGLWELGEAMYVRAAAALEIPVPAALRPVGDFTRRVLGYNRLEARLELACGLIEAGQREAARVVAAERVRLTPAEVAELPAPWQVELHVQERLLAVIAREPDLAGGPAAVPADLFDRLAGTAGGPYRGYLLLAGAIGALDSDGLAAAASAERAAPLLDERHPGGHALALQLAALGADVDDAAARYSRHLAALRWQARMDVLAAARARLVAARILRQGEQLRHQAYVDALTGLANRHAESRHLARLRRSDAHDRLGVVLIDLDRFKGINDTFGHTVGDAVLRVIGAVLRGAVRSSDLAVRMGGDEFMLLVDLHAVSDVSTRVHAIVDAVTGHDWDSVAPGLCVTISAGQAVGAARDVDALVKAADDNLYRAKSAGRGRAVTLAPE
jgi:diguanylate cyclase (GGDEF)-like protein